MDHLLVNFNTLKLMTKLLLILNQQERWFVTICWTEETFLLSTGTGLAPFMSIIRDPETYERFDKVILTHTVRTVKELAYFDTLNNLNEDEIYSQVTQGKFYYFNTVTREKWDRTGRITEWIENNNLWSYLKIDHFDPKQDRVMICGSEDMTFELKTMFENFGSVEGSTKVQGGFVIEKAFAEK